MNCQYQGAYHLIIQAYNITSESFELKSGIAGDILQKFSDYGGFLVIGGSFDTVSSNNLRAFITESNRSGRVFIAGTHEEAKHRLWAVN